MPFDGSDGLGLTARQYAEAVGPSIKGGRPEALRRYSGVFRDGGEGPGFARPRVVGEQKSESPDGVVTKFLLSVPPGTTRSEQRVVARILMRRWWCCLGIALRCTTSRGLGWRRGGCWKRSDIGWSCSMGVAAGGR